MLTQKDLQQIKLLLEVVTSMITGRIDKLESRMDKFDDKQEEVDEKISHLPTKKEYYDREDRVMGELQKMRDNMGVLVGWKDQIEDHEERIETLEQHMKVIKPRSL